MLGAIPVHPEDPAGTLHALRLPYTSPQYTGQCYVAITDAGKEVIILHSQTAESLRSLAQSILVACQEQFDEDGRARLSGQVSDEAPTELEV
jgi:hypothetical protein